MEHVTISDATEYRKLRDKVDAYEKAIKRKFPNRNGFTRAEIESLGVPAPTNAEMSAVETWEFRHSAPAHYFAYVSNDEKCVTTWTGQILGTITFLGPKGPSKRALQVDAINGRRYSGNYHCGDGDYCRLKLAPK